MIKSCRNDDTVGMATSPVILQPGDVFCVEKGRFPASIIETLISLVEKRDPGGRPRYIHSGIIASEQGKTLESLWHVQFGNLSDYDGQEILISRIKGGLSAERFAYAFQKVYAEHYGERYPINRLFLNLFGLAGVVHFQKVVCSELVAEFLKYALKGLGVFELHHYFGWKPSDLAEIFVRWTAIFEIVYRGKWSNSLLYFNSNDLRRQEILNAGARRRAVTYY